MRRKSNALSANIPGERCEPSLSSSPKRKVRRTQLHRETVTQSHQPAPFIYENQRLHIVCIRIVLFE